MKIRLLGTGTSQGVPVIGCTCEVCCSDDPKDRRLRTAALVTEGDTTICIDTGPDFRQQMLQAGVSRLDGVLLTHEHNDHIIGIDDTRPFVFRQNIDMPVYGLQRVLNDLKLRFAYVFSEHKYAGIPRILAQPLLPFDRLTIGDIKVQSLAIDHGSLPILGYRFGDLCYITDASHLPAETLSEIFGVKILIINALHHEPHLTHFNLQAALGAIALIRPELAILTHMSHHMGLHEVINAQLPANVLMGYDGMEIEF